MRHARQWVIFTTVIALAACSSENSDRPQGVIPAAQRQALDKANEVDDLAGKRQEDIREQLDAMD